MSSIQYAYGFSFSSAVDSLFTSLSSPKQKEGSLIPSSCMKASSLSVTPVEMEKKKDRLEEGKFYCVCVSVLDKQTKETQSEKL